MEKVDRRVLSLDRARGLLILLMTSTHALTMANVPATSFFQSDLWLPRGWATFSFTILSGFTIATVFAGKQDRSRTNSFLLSRAYQLLIVMVVSTAVFEIIKAAFSGRLSVVLDWFWWAGLLTFHTPYGLSGVFLPISLLLAISPILFWCHARWGYVTLTCAVAAGSLGAWWVSFIDQPSAQSSHLMNVLFYKGVGGFRVMPFLAMGALGFCLGLKRTMLSSRLVLTRLLIVAALLAAAKLLLFPVSLAVLLPFLGVVLGFILMLHLSLLTSGTDALVTIGQYGLFSFLAHRVLIQALGLTVPVLADQPADALYAEYLAGTMILLWALCRARAQSHRLHTFLKACYV